MLQAIQRARQALTPSRFKKNGRRAQDVQGSGRRYLSMQLHRPQNGAHGETWLNVLVSEHDLAGGGSHFTSQLNGMLDDIGAPDHVLRPGPSVLPEGAFIPERLEDIAEGAEEACWTPPMTHMLPSTPRTPMARDLGFDGVPTIFTAEPQVMDIVHSSEEDSALPEDILTQANLAAIRAIIDLFSLEIARTFVHDEDEAVLYELSGKLALAPTLAYSADEKRVLARICRKLALDIELALNGTDIYLDVKALMIKVGNPVKRSTSVLRNLGDLGCAHNFEPGEGAALDGSASCSACQSAVGSPDPSSQVASGSSPQTPASPTSPLASSGSSAMTPASPLASGSSNERSPISATETLPGGNSPGQSTSASPIGKAAATFPAAQGTRHKGLGLQFGGFVRLLKRAL